MKKLKYYAPYWVSALILIAFAVFILPRFKTTAFSELPQLAAELESEQHFIREDGTVMKATGDHSPNAIVDIVNGMPHRIGALKVKELNAMHPHEYAALIHDIIYIRQDGSVFARQYGFGGDSKEFIAPVCPLSELPDTAAEAEWEIREIYSPDGFPSSRIGLYIPAKTVEEEVACYLAVKLANGWYIAAESIGNITEYDFEYNGLFHKHTLCFPTLQEGEYRIETCINGEWYYQELTLTRKGTDTYTLT